MYDENIQRIKEMGEKIGVLEERNNQLENQVKLLYNFKKEV